MCGINGCLHNDKMSYHMNDFIIHTDFLSKRGPDQSGYDEYSINNNKLKFGHRRLSILDLNKLANQPMQSSNNKYSIIFNGEIYNHNKLRDLIDQKESIKWKTTCDTETLINLFQFFDINKILNLVEGMFALAVLDKNKNILYLARDRSGEKPLYITCGNNFFAFSSDLISLKNIPNFKKNINQSAVEKYLQHNYIPSPLTIYKSSFKLPSASLISIDLNKFIYNEYKNFYDFVNSNGVNFLTWWKTKIKKKNELPDKFTEYNQTKKFIKKLLNQSIENQLLSDAPIGAFLSSGTDSSLIVSMMKELKKNPQTFTIGFENSDYDESSEAKKIANYLNTSHTEYIFSNNDVIKMIPNVGSAYSEPFADSSQIPTMLVSNIASSKVKVALSGDGGDELFCGYNRYLYANKYWKIINILPFNVRVKLVKLIRLLPHKIFSQLFMLILPKIRGSKYNHVDKILDKLIKIRNGHSYYQTMVTEWETDDNIMKFNNINEKHQYNSINDFDENNILDSMMHADFNTYLCDDILCKVDRASMHYGLEVRAPFLMSDLIETAFKIPINFKIQGNKTKHIIKDILSDYLPKEFLNKPKKGFGMPISNWMKNELKDWTNDMLSKKNNSMHGLFNQNVVDKIKEQHFKNVNNHEHKLWSLIQFNSWYQNIYN